jgi:hypothetical protein
MRHIRELGETTMRKIAVLLGAVAIAAAPSLAMADGYAPKPAKKHYSSKHHTKHYVKKEVKPTDPNENTYKLFSNMFAGK